MAILLLVVVWGWLLVLVVIVDFMATAAVAAAAAGGVVAVATGLRRGESGIQRVGEPWEWLTETADMLEQGWLVG